MKTAPPNPESIPPLQLPAALARGRTAPGLAAMILLTLLLALFGTTQTRAQGIPPGCVGSAIGISLFTSAPDVHVGDTIFYSVSVFNGIVGNPTSCDASNIIATITTPDGVVHPITLTRTYLMHTQSDFYNNVVSYVARAQDIRPDGSLRATAEDTAVIFQNDTPSMGGANQGVNTEVSQPCINLIVQCINSIGANGAITFNGTVTNCGNNTLVSVTVTNYVNGGAFPVFFPTNILRGQSATFTGSYVPADPCNPSTATLVATAVDQFTSIPRRVVSTNLTTCQAVITRGIQVTKQCPVSPTAPGQLVIFTGSVSNTGNITITNVVVVNDQPVPGTVVFTRATLAQGEVVRFTNSYVAPTNCSVTDTLTATGTGACGVPVSSTATATCPIVTTPGITVTEVCPLTPGVSGGSSSYSGVVRNSGNITLNNVQVFSDRPVANTLVLTVASLAPGASANYSANFTVPLNVCSVTTGVRATGSDACTGIVASNTATATCPVLTTPAIGVTLTCPIVPSTNGGPITYNGTVLNSGNVTLTNVVVTDSQSSPTTVFTVASLAPGASANFTASFTAPTNTCSISSTVIARGADNCTQLTVSNSASATCALTTTAGIVVTENCPVAPAVPGGPLIYTGTVRNSGDITLTNIVVVNNQSGVTPVFTWVTLAPGALVSFTNSYLTPTNCSSTSTSIATGRSICGVSVTNSATASCTITTAPAIKVTLVCPVIAPALGEILFYTGTVSNSGNITLSNVMVVNSRSGPSPIFTVAFLAPHAVANFSGSYTVPPNCCVVSSTVTGSGQGCDGRVVTDTASSTCPVRSSPGIVVTKVCTGSPAGPGELVTYSGYVSNSGNISLTDVYIVNSVPTNNSPVFGPVTLAPGDSMNYTASYVMPPDFCGTDTISARGTSCASTVTNSVTSSCPIKPYSPGLRLTKNCPVSPPPRGGLFIYTGTVQNTGNVTLVQVFVISNEPVPNTPVLGPITLAPGASSNFTASFTAPDCCEVPTTLNARGQDKCALTVVTARISDVCLLLTTPGITVTENCPPAPVPIGGLFEFTGMVSNSGLTTLMNVYVRNQQAGSNTPLLGPIELAPGETETFNGSYIVLAATNVSTNAITTPVTNGAAASFGTINPVNQAVIPRFNATNNLSGMSYADQDEGYAATQFYAMRKDNSGMSFFDTLTAGTGLVRDRFAASSRNFDALAFAAPDLSYGPVIFYYLSHDSGGVSRFGTIKPGGVVGVVEDHFVVGSGFDSLTFSATDVGFGANLFYYVRHDAGGLSTFGTINPALPGTVTDRFTVGNNVDALVFTPADVGAGYGVNRFYYLRHNAAGASTFGTIFVTSPTTGIVTDRFTVGTNVNRLTFAATDTGYGANLFYFLRGGSASTVTTLSTNVGPASASVLASGIDICQFRTVTATASCFGPVPPFIGGAGVPPARYTNGVYSLSFATQIGVSYTVQYKNSLSDATWTNLQTVIGTGGSMTVSDTTGFRAMRFYRVITP